MSHDRGGRVGVVVGDGGGGGAGAPRVVHVAQAPVDEATVALTLLTDLSGLLPPDLTLDFQADGVDVAPDKCAIVLLIDTDKRSVHTTNRCQLRGLAIGYHLLRAFLVDAEGLCLKSEVAAVAAEFFVVEAVSTGDRSFMFGQPSLCVLQPWGALTSIEKADRLRCDLFVWNCELGEGASGYGVRVVINGSVVTTWRQHSAFDICSLGAAPKVVLQLTLVNPADDVVGLSSWERVVSAPVGSRG